MLFCFLNEEVKKEIKKVIRQKCFRVSNLIAAQTSLFQYNLNERRRGSIWDSSMNVTYASGLGYIEVDCNTGNEKTNSILFPDKSG